jgi:hypothetical protein
MSFSPPDSLLYLVSSYSEHNQLAYILCKNRFLIASTAEDLSKNFGVSLYIAYIFANLVLDTGILWLVDSGPHPHICYPLKVLFKWPEL